MRMTESVSSTNRDELNGVSNTYRDDLAVTRPGGKGGSGLLPRLSWSFSTVLHTLPPLASLTAGTPPSDPAARMLRAVKAAGGCFEIPEGGYSGRWVVLQPEGAALRFPEPVGHRLASQGLICRHPMDVPGAARRFVRFIPKERMPTGFEFNLVQAMKQVQAEIRQKQIKARIEERKIWFAALTALRRAQRAKLAVPRAQKARSPSLSSSWSAL